MQRRLADVLSAELGRPPLEDAEAAELEAALAACLAAAQAAHPALAVEPAAFVAHLARRLPAGEPLAAIRSVCAGDLYLAFACANGDAAAQEELDRGFLSKVPHHVARFSRSSDFADEVQQLLRQTLLVPKPGAAAGRLLDYSGHGALGRFIQVAAMRIAVSLQRSDKPTTSPDVLDLILPGSDPELDFIKLRDRDAVRTAILDAIRGLESRDLGLLRLHYMEQVPLDKLAAMHRVHRATVVRWIASARGDILSRARKLLRERLALSNAECDSLIQLVQSRLEVSLSGALAAGE